MKSSKQTDQKPAIPQPKDKGNQPWAGGNVHPSKMQRPGQGAPPSRVPQKKP